MRFKFFEMISDGSGRSATGRRRLAIARRETNTGPLPALTSTGRL